VNLTFLGGIDEIGASCTLVEVAGHRLLVDAGIRMKGRNEERLPYLERLSELGGVDAIVLTHAHVDHSGSLPLVHQRYPAAPIYMTPATMNLVSILLQDSAKIMALQEETDVPLYNMEEVARTLEAIRPLPFDWSLPLFDGQVQATFFPAGHILGAASLWLESPEGTLLIAGDISLADQVTIPGAQIPALQPDCILVESTYGGKVHSDRRKEEERLTEQVDLVMQRRGSVLFPAFAVGRAQEIILLLAEAIEEERLPRAAVFVDGMVKAVCKAYISHPKLLSKGLRRRIDRYQDPFFYRNGFVLPVWDPRTRKKVANTQPAIIVSSSGMLTGGPSQLYARELSQGQRNLLAITGYQDEESPGRQVQDLARAGGGTLRLGETEVTFTCAVATYGLSAHADSQEITRWLQTAIGGRQQPTDILLGHGDDGAREDLRARLQEVGLDQVSLPVRGQTVEVVPRGTGGISVPSPLPTVALLQKEDLVGLAQRLVDRDRPNMLYTVQDLLLAWGDPLATHDAQEKQRVTELLEAPKSPFRKSKKLPFLFRVLLGQEVRWKDTTGPLEINKALQRAGMLFPKDTGIYKRGAEVERQVLVLWSDFPLDEEELEEPRTVLQEETGWQVEFRVRTRHDNLKRLAKECIGLPGKAPRQPAILPAEMKVVVFARPPDGSPKEIFEEARERMEAFTQKTGYQIKVVWATQEALQGGVAGPSALPVKDGGRLELNAAYSRIRLAFRGRPHELLKVGCKGPYLEVAFISLSIGECYRELLDELAEETGWPIQIKSTLDQVRIEKVAWSLVDAKKMSFYQAEHRLEVVVETLPEEKEQIQKTFAERTGCTLTFLEVG
jgi:uncharacterized protein